MLDEEVAQQYRRADYVLYRQRVLYGFVDQRFGLGHKRNRQILWGGGYDPVPYWFKCFEARNGSPWPMVHFPIEPIRRHTMKTLKVHERENLTRWVATKHPRKGLRL